MPDAPDNFLNHTTHSTLMQSDENLDEKFGQKFAAISSGQAGGHPDSAVLALVGSAPMSVSNSPLPVAPDMPALSFQWEQALESVPLGVAVLEGTSGKTQWTNRAMRKLLTAGAGLDDVLDWQPHEYLPNMQPRLWSDVLAHALQPNAGNPDLKQGRLQFVHHATRNIAYWEWKVEALDEPNAAVPHLLLTVQNVSDVVMNERQLATAVRTSQQARRDSEALSSLAQMLNQSLTTPDLLRTVVHEAAAYFDTQHAAVLLLDADGQHFKVGYSIGLQSILDAGTEQDWTAELAAHLDSPQDSITGITGIAALQCSATLAGRSIEQRRTLVTTFPGEQGIKTPTLSDGKTPAALVTSPIQQNGHTYGVVEVYFSEARDIRPDSLTLLSTFADQTAVGLLKADLYQQIASQRSQLQSIFDNAPVGILYFNAQGVAVTANAAAARNYAGDHGGSEEIDGSLLLGQHCTALFPDLPAPVFAAALNGKSFHASHVVSTRTPGREIIYDVSLVPVSGHDEGAGLLLLTFEVTELVHARQEADHARRDAEDALAAVRATQTQMVQMEKMRAVGELAQGVAHDINNALMAVLGYTELAGDDLDDPEALTNHLAIIKKAAEDASSTVKRLNKFAKRGIATHGDHTDINEVVKDVVQMTRPRWRDGAHKEGRSYEVQMNLGEVLPIIGEPSGLREVLINMIHNALNAMPHGGDLTLATCMHDPGQVEIEVADTGAGMTPEVMSRIFDPFFTTRLEGTGLGLAVSWSIIQRHGGTIVVESTVGVGTRFLIRLPVTLTDRPEVPLPSPAKRLLNATPGTPILIVDDESIVSGVLSSILGRHGYRVTIANSAQEALVALRAEGAAYRLVMTDHGMPGMNGLQLIAEIQNTHPGLPTLLLTGWGDTVLQNNVVEAMPDAVLGKPINQSDLLETLARLVPPREAYAVTKTAEQSQPPTPASAEAQAASQSQPDALETTVKT